MKHVIIGTAGHVDHGKTKLIQALTGIDTDRLQEEKKRGITIELGFAHLDFPDGTQAGIVDVPGHEKFIKNMLAGAGGIDLAMLIVAADEGFMPQTVEHLNILSLLGIQDGLVVVTKMDTVEESFLDFVEDDIREHVKGTFLEDKPIVPVSAYTGFGIPELQEKLREMVQAAGEKDLRSSFRLPVDRVFSVEGFGTVVTGTLIEGCIHVNDPAQLALSGAPTKIRNLQVHGQTVDTAYAGQRVAINLSGLKKADIGKGEIVCKPDSVTCSYMLDVRLQNLEGSGRIIRTASQLHLFHGSSALVAKAVLLDREELKPGESCFAQLRLTQPLACKNGDRFVIRFFSPVETIGGGVILNASPRKHKRNDEKVLNALEVAESGSGEQRVLQVLLDYGLVLPSREELEARTGIQDLGPSLAEFVNHGKAIEILPDRYAAAPLLDQIWESCQEILTGYHQEHPLHVGIRAAELRQKLLPRTELPEANGILRELILEGRMKQQAEHYALPEFSVHYTKRQASIREKLIKFYQSADRHAPMADAVIQQYPLKEQEDARQVMESLISARELVMLTPQIIFAPKAYKKVCKEAKAWFETHDTLTLAEFRDLLNTSRKYSQAILEYFDRCKLTKREGDLRVPGSVPFR